MSALDPMRPERLAELLVSVAPSSPRLAPGAPALAPMGVLVRGGCFQLGRLRHLVVPVDPSGGRLPTTASRLEGRLDPAVVAMATSAT